MPLLPPPRGGARAEALPRVRRICVRKLPGRRQVPALRRPRVRPRAPRRSAARPASAARPSPAPTGAPQKRLHPAGLSLRTEPFQLNAACARRRSAASGARPLPNDMRQSNARQQCLASAPLAPRPHGPARPALQAVRVGRAHLTPPAPLTLTHMRGTQTARTPPCPGPRQTAPRAGWRTRRMPRRTLPLRSARSSAS